MHQLLARASKVSSTTRGHPALWPRVSPVYTLAASHINMDKFIDWLNTTIHAGGIVASIKREAANDELLNAIARALASMKDRLKEQYRKLCALHQYHCMVPKHASYGMECSRASPVGPFNVFMRGWLCGTLKKHDQPRGTRWLLSSILLGRRDPHTRRVYERGRWASPALSGPSMRTSPRSLL